MLKLKTPPTWFLEISKFYISTFSAKFLHENVSKTLIYLHASLCEGKCSGITECVLKDFSLKICLYLFTESDN